MIKAVRRKYVSKNFLLRRLHWYTHAKSCVRDRSGYERRFYSCELRIYNLIWVLEENRGERISREI